MHYWSGLNGPSGLNWTKLDQVDQIGQNELIWTKVDLTGPKWTEVNRMDWSRLNRLKWTKLDQNRPNGLKCYDDMAHHECGNNKYYVLAFTF